MRISEQEAGRPLSFQRRVGIAAGGDPCGVARQSPVVGLAGQRRRRRFGAVGTRRVFEDREGVGRRDACGQRCAALESAFMVHVHAQIPAVPEAERVPVGPAFVAKNRRAAGG